MSQLNRASSDMDPQDMKAMNFADVMAEMFVNGLKNGTALDSSREIPMNVKSGRQYSPVTSLYLSMYLSMQNKSDPRWMTMKQGEAMGVMPDAKERGTEILWFSAKNQERPQLMTAVLYNASQMPGLPPLPERVQGNPRETVDKLMNDLGCKVTNAGKKAGYNAAKDEIVLPKTLKNDDKYCVAAVKALCEWSISQDRMQGEQLSMKELSERPLLTNACQGSDEHARQSLSVEIAACQLCSNLGVAGSFDQKHPDKDHWAKLVLENPLELTRACKTAQYMVTTIDRDRTLELDRMQEIQIKPEKQEKQETQKAQAAKPKAPEMVQLKVLYEDREKARELGAKWDNGKKSWCVAKGTDLAPFKELEDNYKQFMKEWAEKKAEPQPEKHREYLYVPFEKRNEARELGAKFDGLAKAWYVGENADREGLKQFIEPQAIDDQKYTQTTPQEEFAEKCAKCGLKLEGQPIMDGQSHAVSNGSYRAVLDQGRPHGIIMNDETKKAETWVYVGQKLSEEERQRLNELKTQKQEENRAKRNEANENVANKCDWQLKKQLQPVTEAKYLQDKGIQAHKGLFKTNNKENPTIIVPVQDTTNKVWAMQYLFEDGSQTFSKGGKKSGNFHIVDGGGIDRLKNADCVMICADYASAATVAEKTGHCAVSTIDSDNLISASKALKSAMPEQAFVICGTLDNEKSHKQAEDAAQSIGASLVFPVAQQGVTNMNDMAKIMGGESVKLEVGHAVKESMAVKEARSQKQEQVQKQEEKRGMRM